MFNKEIKVSIITACYNSAAFIQEAMSSVFNQSYDNIEYIIMDGSSTDGTVEIIRKHADKISFWVSEPDRGISHAWNKALTHCTGDVIGILNADDFYAPEAVRSAVRAFAEHPEAGFVFGDAQMCDIDGAPLYRQEGDPLYRTTIAFAMPSIPHPTVFVRHSIYEQFGGFDESYKTAMDYEFLLRITRQGVNGYYLPTVLTNMRLGGESDTNFTGGYREVRQASVKYGYSKPKALARYSYRCIRSIVRRTLERLGLNRPVRAFRALTGSRYKYTNQRIFINARFLTQPVTGVQRYALEMVKALDYLLETGDIDRTRYRFELLAPRRGIQHEIKLKNIPLRRVGLLTGHAWEQLELPFYSRKGLLFCLGNTAPVISLLSEQSTVLTIHSLSFLLFPEAYSITFKLFYKLIIPMAVRSGDAVITVSQSEKEAILNKYGAMEKRLYAIQNGALNEDFLSNLQELSETSDSEINKPFVLYVGSLSKGKNLRGLLEAMTLINRNHDVPLVVVGATGKTFNKEDFNLPEEIAAKVVFKGQVDNTGELVSLYKASLCLVFPSFYESSGLPPLEAMACGCPVVASEIPSLRERCGDAALYCNPDDPEDIAHKIRLIMNDPQLREALRTKGLERASPFTWQKCAAETFDVIKCVLSQKGECTK